MMGDDGYTSATEEQLPEQMKMLVEAAYSVALGHSNYGHVEGNKRAFAIAEDIRRKLPPTSPVHEPAEEEVERRFDQWWRASKYRQVIYATEIERQIALDAWRAALREGV